jgi:anti-sigma factor RsiW
MGEVMNAHLRSLQEGHAMDVVSTDQHTVKPWFTGKVSFAVPVRDFAAEGFPLAGGRLELLDGRPAAALVYRRRAHVLNLFVQDAPGAASASPERARSRGYGCWRWTQGGLRFWLVGDVAEDELELFARRLAASGG